MFPHISALTCLLLQLQFSLLLSLDANFNAMLMLSRKIVEMLWKFWILCSFASLLHK